MSVSTPLSRIAPLLSSFGWSCILVALVGFPDGRFPTRFARALAWLAPFAVWSRKATDLVARLLSFDNAISFASMLIALLILVAVAQRYRATPPGAERQQIKWAVFGISVSLIGVAIAFVVDAVGPALGIPLDGLIGWLLPVPILGGLPLGLLVSQRRYRLYDADAAISRSVALGLLTLGLLAVFAGSEKLIELLGEEYLGESLGTVAGALAAALAAVTIAPLHHRITHWAEHRFQGALAHLKTGLPLLVGDLRETASPQAIADAALLRIERGARARHGALIVGERVLDTRDVDAQEVARWLGEEMREGELTLDLDRSDPLFPVRVRLAADGVGTVGWLLLGPRPDGSFYGRDERETLGVLADPLARALAISLAREERQAARVTEFDQFRQLLGALTARISALEGQQVVNS